LLQVQEQQQQILRLLLVVQLEELLHLLELMLQHMLLRLHQVHEL
jgi:hypothetical protein